ncbi:isoflavone reductase family protein CipA [Coniochaeta ligniaria NRRL 30616]|uniref:Isoflavone reductase family protein CipA n=1 Tax=Coniochaeta ligniaria NRRL 30616 TaxID=1408157 RepID=A0A1J7IT06_9PEZI|nr:isoflavone reductase family protein CipA [Coniochaeta ligniaria NRRL 30616]
MGSTSPREIQNVALAGATGNVGSNVLNALVGLDRFHITVLTRKEGASLPAGVTVKVADFTSVEALTEILKGQDAVIDTTSSPESQTPINLINAAAAAGVYRYITSDFGFDPLNPKVANLPVFGRKAASLKEARAANEKTGMTYTAVATGPFLDWNLRNRFSGIDLSAKKVQFFDEGANKIPWTTLEAVGKGVAAVLVHPEETENRPVYISSVVKSQREVVELAKEALGADGWEITKLDMDGVFKKAMEGFKAGDYSRQTMAPMIQYGSAREDYIRPWEKDDNALLGIEPMTDDELKALIKDLATASGK